MKTLHVYRYRNVNIYIRHLFKETFEYLVPLRGQIFSNVIEFNKKRRDKNRPYTQDEEAHVIDTLKHIAQTFIDEDKVKRSVGYKLNTFLHERSSKSESAEPEAERDRRTGNVQEAGDARR